AELLSGLKSSVAPELVANMSRLYEYMYHTLVQAHLEKDENKINQVIELLRPLRETWVQAMEKVEEDPENHGMPVPEEEKVKERPSFSLEA
ncbi:MAG: flagellar protein FliS, partial [Planctomycetes bacterium]|nr:flagellar protein FliS [Planctomycetota bacterium]